ncbi:hypothetical protein Tdes44962_MAKER01123 [Teratosphaeria destructans]|uniref:Uncharacterized protein n=1 Tax=Teratosphaeria destructans TaxID=418781 RepID=A0A9W7T1T4_9PEZI|nr:hypothetical protein Tdes44962_MAKER01123 [Teratosphaeria destructans]
MNVDDVLVSLAQRFQSDDAFAADVRAIVQDTATSAHVVRFEASISKELQERGSKGQETRDSTTSEYFNLQNRWMAEQALQLWSNRTYPPQGPTVWLTSLALRVKGDVPFRKLLRRVAKGKASPDQELLFTVLNLKIGQEAGDKQVRKAFWRLLRYMNRDSTEQSCDSNIPSGEPYMQIYSLHLVNAIPKSHLSVLLQPE